MVSAASQDDLRTLYGATAAKMLTIDAEMVSQKNTLQTFLSVHGTDLETRLQNQGLVMQQTRDVITGMQRNTAKDQLWPMSEEAKTALRDGNVPHSDDGKVLGAIVSRGGTLQLAPSTLDMLCRQTVPSLVADRLPRRRS